MFSLKQVSVKQTMNQMVLNFNNQQDDDDAWSNIVSKCLGGRHLQILSKIPDITMSDAGEPSISLFSNDEECETGRDASIDLNSYQIERNSPNLLKTIIEKVPDSPESVASSLPSRPSYSPQLSPHSPHLLSHKLSLHTSQLSSHASPVRKALFSPLKELQVSTSSLPSRPSSPHLSPHISEPTSDASSVRKLRSSTSSQTSVRGSRASASSPHLSPHTSQPSSRASSARKLRASTSSHNSSVQEPRSSTFSHNSSVREPRSSTLSHNSSVREPRSSISSLPLPSSPRTSQLSSNTSPVQKLRASTAFTRPKRSTAGKRFLKWRGERPVYRPLENGCYEFVGATKLNSPDFRKMKRKRQSTKKFKTQMDVEPKQITIASESFVQRSDDSRDKTDLIKALDELEWRVSKCGNFQNALTFKVKDKMAIGFIKLKGLSEKPPQKTANYETVYKLEKGSVAIKIGDEPHIIINPHELVTIPPLTNYTIKNLSEDESLIQFIVNM